MTSRVRNLAATLASALALAASPLAAEPAPAPPAPQAEPTQAEPTGAGAPPQPGAGAQEPKSGVALDQLLVLPSSRSFSVERKGGLTRGEWRTRYVDVQAELQKERDALAAAQGKLTDAGGGQWKVNPIPGADTSGSQDSPIDFQLRSELRRHREEIERLERKVRQLDIEANLAGVPEDWRS